MPTLTTTSGSASANSYVSLSDAVTFFESWLNADAWDAADDTNREKALVMAAKQLQRENWIGQRATTTQALAWPRTGAEKPDSYGGWTDFGWAAHYETTEIPQEVKDAQCLLALALLNGYGQTGGSTVKSFSADGFSVSFGETRSETVLPVDVTRMLAPLLRGNQLARA
jgi:hypothetical protein